MVFRPLPLRFIASPPDCFLQHFSPMSSTQAALKGLHGLFGNFSRGPTSLGTWMLREGLCGRRETNLTILTFFLMWTH